MKFHNVKTHQEVELDTEEQIRNFGANIADRDDWREGPAPAAEGATSQAGDAVASGEGNAPQGADSPVSDQAAAQTDANTQASA